MRIEFVTKWTEGQASLNGGCGKGIQEGAMFSVYVGVWPLKKVGRRSFSGDGRW